MHPQIKFFESNLNAGKVNHKIVSNFSNWLEKTALPDEEKAYGLDLVNKYHGRPVGGAGGSLASGLNERREGRQPTRATNDRAGDPAILGQPFHNPYTFIPFSDIPPRRQPPTPVTIDEVENDRFTGILDLEVKLLSPLLTNNPVHVLEIKGHKTYKALTIGDDVIVPATGVRGALRTLMSALTNGTLGHLDEEAWLCQGRDARLGPDRQQRSSSVPKYLHLGRVVERGGHDRAGIIQVGRTQLVDIEQVACAIAAWKNRPVPQRVPEPGPRPHGPPPDDYKERSKQYRYYLKRLDELIADYRPHYDADRKEWVTPKLFASISDSMISHLSDTWKADCPWQIKLSHRPINLGERRPKSEGAFLENDGAEITVPSSIWMAYRGRYRHSEHQELEKDDLVWLEPMDPACAQISDGNQIKSMQWARWGRAGERLLDVVAKFHPAHLPDAFNPDGKVDEVTNLFGQVPREDVADEVPAFRGWKVRGLPGPAGPFAARVRCGNLIFTDATKGVVSTTLAPLAQPHPGCAAFYRNWAASDPGQAADKMANHNLPLRGFKVYRTSSERNDEAPWKYSVQGTYGDRGNLQPSHQTLNKTADLLPETCGIKGRVRIIVRALSERELALVLAACSVDWRVGGGKPLGLGHCSISSVTLRRFKDDGTLEDVHGFEPHTETLAKIPSPYAGILAEDDQLLQRMELWQSIQKQVAKLRYPRAVSENSNRKTRGGHVWFARHVQPKKSIIEGEAPVGLETRYLSGKLQVMAKTSLLRAQPLPRFDAGNASADFLYGYDLFYGEGDEWSEFKRSEFTQKFEKHLKKMEPFDPDLHARSADASGGHQGQSRESRQQQRYNR